MKTARALPLLLLATLAATGCKPDAAVKKGEVLDKNATPAAAQSPVSGPVGSAALNTAGVDATQLSTVTGSIKFNGQPPVRVRIDMSMDPACSLTPGENLSEPYIVSHGKLANVFVYIKAGAQASTAPAGSPPVVLDQKGCRYVPHVIALQQGGSVEFHNSDPTMHNIHTTPVSGNNPGVDISQGPMGSPQVQQFNSPEIMLPVRCNNHPWMNAFINVAPNPYFAISATDGSFTIAGLPPGNYTLAAVHEKLGEQDLQITVPAKSKIKADFAFAAK